MSSLPSVKEIEEWMSANPDKISRKDIARAFGVKASDKPALGKRLREVKEKAREAQSNYHVASIVDVTEDAELVGLLMGSDVVVTFEGPCRARKRR